MSPELVSRIRAGTRHRSNWLELAKFGLVGASGYAANLIVFAILVNGLGIHHLLGAVAAFSVAVSNNFLWNRNWTFEASTGHAGVQAVRFFGISVAALLINLIALQLLIEAGLGALGAQALAVAIAMPFNFVGNKLWTFDWTRR